MATVKPASRIMKETWLMCSDIAEKYRALFSDRQEVFSFCLYDLRATGKLADAVAGTLPAEEIIALPGYKRLEKVRMPLPSTVAKTELRYEKEDEATVDDPTAIRMAFWLIKRVGNSERAIRAVKAAVAGLKSMERLPNN